MPEMVHALFLAVRGAAGGEERVHILAQCVQ